jgi:hypothetical protein
MDRKDLIGAVAASMAMTSSQTQNPTPKDLEEERVAEKREEKPNDDDAFIINIPMITGRVYKVDARQVNWNALGTPESQANLENNEGTIRAMVHALVTADFTDPKTENMIKDFDESIMNLFSNFGIGDPGYGELAQKTMAKPYILLLGKCFDALTLINVIAHNTAMHGLATQVFGITDSFKEVANLNDITEMDNSTDGLISADRNAFEESLIIMISQDCSAIKLYHIW